MSDSVITMAAPGDAYRQRRARLATSLKRPLVLFAGHAPARNYATNPHRFRAGSTYLYFGGPPLEHAALVVEPGSDGDEGCTLLRPVFGPEEALWFGDWPDDDELARVSGLSRPRLQSPDQLQWLAAGHEAAAIVPPYPDTIRWAEELDLGRPTDDELRAIVDMRLCKDEHELTAMRRSAAIAMEAHRAALAACGSGGREADVAAAFTEVLVRHGAEHSFSPIVTIRGEILHASGHGNELRDGALMVVDAGAEEPTGYASDFTRTFPVNGRWSAVQRHLYETVLRANEACVEAAVPGARFRDLHDLSARIICEGLVEAELLRGEASELAARAAHALFYPHGLGHLIGLDAHDMEDFGDLAGYAPGRSRRPEFGNKSLRLDRDLAPGMCVTIEPGLYFVHAIWETEALVQPFADVINRTKVDALLNERFGGIRIEHTIAVRGAEGPEVLSEELPVKPDEIAALVGAGR